jgi:hypothetical protein
MITEDYVSPETAMLLKEKVFDGYCDLCFNFIEIPRRIVNVPSDGKVSYEDGILKEEIVLIPTLQMATKWLRKNFSMNPVPYATSIGWYFEVFDLTQRDITGCALLYQVGIPSKEKTFETSEEACEAGIKYCLENLI